MRERTGHPHACAMAMKISTRTVLYNEALNLKKWMSFGATLRDFFFFLVNQSNNQSINKVLTKTK